MKIDAIGIKSEDNVATALKEIDAGQKIVIGVGNNQIEMVAKEHIPFGHKFAIVNIAEGDDILKYGEIIGRATREIPQGVHAHIQNIESLRGRGDLDKEAL